MPRSDRTALGPAPDQWRLDPRLLAPTAPLPSRPKAAQARPAHVRRSALCALPHVEHKIRWRSSHQPTQRVPTTEQSALHQGIKAGSRWVHASKPRPRSSRTGSQRSTTKRYRASVVDRNEVRRHAEQRNQRSGALEEHTSRLATPADPTRRPTAGIPVASASDSPLRSTRFCSFNPRSPRIERSDRRQTPCLATLRQTFPLSQPCALKEPASRIAALQRCRRGYARCLGLRTAWMGCPKTVSIQCWRLVRLNRRSQALPNTLATDG